MVRELLTRRHGFAAAVAVLAALAAPAHAAQPQLVVLRVAGEDFGKAILDSATTAAETAALRISAGRFKIVTRDMLATIVGEERLLKCEAAARCELDLGTGLGTEYLLAGTLRKVGARLEVAMKLYDARRLSLLSQEKESASREEELVDRVEPLVERVVRGGLALGGLAAARPASGLGTFEEAPQTSFAAGPEEVLVSFESAPEGATVLVDGRLLCKETPCRKAIGTGSHQASFQKERHSESVQRFTAAKGAVVKGTLAPHFGWVSVVTTPPGVSVSIDGAEAGESPVAWREVDEGTVDVAVSDPCWLRSGERVAVRAGERRAVKLAARPRVTGLKVNAEDEKGNALEAEVRVDGQVVGSAWTTLTVPVCAKSVKVALGREVYEGDLRLEEGKVGTVTAKPGPRVGGAEGMVRLPGGTYEMGETWRTVTVRPFLMDVTEVTVAAYEECVKAGKCSVADGGGYCNAGKSDRANHPINCVDWSQATAFCSAVGKRLPTEEEWEWAARGAARGTTYPWGNENPADQLCWDGEGNDLGKRNRQGTCVVGNYPRGNSAQGLKDLAGNVWEWTASTEGDSHVGRGGCWFIDGPRFVAAAIRLRREPSSRSFDLGFRCARTP